MKVERYLRERRAQERTIQTESRDQIMKRDALSERSKCQLIGKRQAHLCVLQHVIEAEVLDQIVRTMDLLVRVLELRLDDECRWVAEAAGRSVVRAGVATLGLDVGNVAVLGRWVSIREKT